MMYEVKVKPQFDETDGSTSVTWFKDKHWRDLCMLLFPAVLDFFEACAKAKEISLLNTLHTSRGLHVQVGYCFQPILSSVRCCLTPGSPFDHTENGCYKLYEFCNIKLVASVSLIGNGLNELVKEVGCSSRNPLGIKSYFPRTANKQLKAEHETTCNEKEEKLHFEKKQVDVRKAQPKHQLHSKPEDSLGTGDTVPSKHDQVCDQDRSPVLLNEESNCDDAYKCHQDGTFSASPDFVVTKKKFQNRHDKPVCTSESGIESEPVSLQECIQQLETISEKNSPRVADCVSESVLHSVIDYTQTLQNDSPERNAVMTSANLCSSLVTEENTDENSELVSIREFIKVSAEEYKTSNASSVGDGESDCSKSNNSESSSSDLETKVVRKRARGKFSKKASKGGCKRPIDDHAVTMELAAIRDCLKLSNQLNEKLSSDDLAFSSKGVNLDNFKFSPSRNVKRTKRQLKTKGHAANLIENDECLKTVDNGGVSRKKASSSNRKKKPLGKGEVPCLKNTSNIPQQLKPVTRSNKEMKHPSVSEYFPVVLVHPLSKTLIDDSNVTVLGDQRQESDNLLPIKLLPLPVAHTSSQESELTGDCENIYTNRDENVGIENLSTEQRSSEINLGLSESSKLVNRTAEDTTMFSRPRLTHKLRRMLSDANVLESKSDLDEFQNQKKTKVNKLKRKCVDALSYPSKITKKQNCLETKNASALKGSSSNKNSASAFEMFSAKDAACKNLIKNPAVASKKVKSRLEFTGKNSQFESSSSDESLPESGIFGAKASNTHCAKNEVSSSTLSGLASDIVKCMPLDDDLNCKAVGFDKPAEPTQDEVSWQLYEEIRNVGDIQQLNERHLRHLLKLNEKYFKDIFRGKEFCQRHEDYIKGGAVKRSLNYKIHLMLFSDEHLDLVLNYLDAIFCKTNKSFADYVLRVLLPETLIKIVMDVRGVTYEESEALMRRATYER